MPTGFSSVFVSTNFSSLCRDRRKDNRLLFVVEDGVDLDRADESNRISSLSEGGNSTVRASLLGVLVVDHVLHKELNLSRTCCDEGVGNPVSCSLVRAGVAHMEVVVEGSDCLTFWCTLVLSGVPVVTVGI